jgi:hypothetical protein
VEEEELLDLESDVREVRDDVSLLGIAVMGELMEDKGKGKEEGKDKDKDMGESEISLLGTVVVVVSDEFKEDREMGESVFLLLDRISEGSFCDGMEVMINSFVVEEVVQQQLLSSVANGIGNGEYKELELLLSLE